MFAHYLTIGWRNLRRSPVYSVINVLGLAIGVAACILIFLYVRDELTYDRFHANGDRIYRVVRSPKPNVETFALNKGVTPYAPLPLGPAMESEIPGIAHAVRIQDRGEATFTVDNRHFGEQIMYADSSFFSVFTFALLAGEPTHVLGNPDALVIRKDIAIKWFGTTDVIGRSVDINLWGTVSRRQITGVIDEYPKNSSVDPRVIASLRSTQTAWNSWNCHVFALLDPLAHRTSIEQQMNVLFESRFKAAGNGNNPFVIALQPMRDIHLDPESGGNNPLFSYILSCIAIAVLLIACINFVTLAMARSAIRAKEVSVRKVFGAVRAQLVRQFWGESLLISAAAIATGIMIAELTLPTFNNLSNKALSLSLVSDLPLCLALGALLLLLTIAAGSVPALLLSRLQPASIFRKQTGFQKGGPVTKTLVVFQYALSITLLICMAGMLSQSRYINSLPLGFDKEQVVVLKNHAPSDMNRTDLIARLRSELAADNRILTVAGASSSINRGWNQLEWPFHGKNLKTYEMDVDEQFLPTLKIDLVAGRNFSKDSPSDHYTTILVNESFVKAAGLTDPVGTAVEDLSTSQTVSSPIIIGVVKDFHLTSLHQEMEPLVLVADPESASQYILVRISGSDMSGAVKCIETAWDKASGGSRFDYSFLDDDVAAQYDADQRWLRIVSYSGIVALIVASLGLFALAGVSAVRRMKEISIRKVLGASVPQVLQVLNAEFIWLILVANLLAWPAAYFILNKWLATFAYRASLSPWTFVLAASLAICAAIAAISVHTLRAASINPSTILRSE